MMVHRGVHEAGMVMFFRLDLKAVSFALLGMVAAFPLWAKDLGCRPELLRQPVQRGLWVDGELSGFDPCHPSVQWRVPTGVANPPVVLAVHGGGGRKDAQAITDAFHQNGYATLIFDAYSMNGFPRTPRLANATRQAMLFKIAQQALAWLGQRPDIDPKRIHAYGISNGAAVVLNLAALGPSYPLRSVFSEAPTPVGMGLPHVIRVPTRMAFGREDDLGAPVGKKRWEISENCRVVIAVPEAPPGTAQHCSQQSPNGRMLTTLEWAKTVTLEGSGRLDSAYFEGVAHGAFIGPLERRTWAEFLRSKGVSTQPFMEKIGWSEGGTDEGRAALLADALRFFEQSAQPTNR
jgi:dienelactone hydrolase